MSKRAAILLCWWFLGSAAHAQVLIDDNFDALDLANWCPCRMNLSAFHVSQLEDGTSFGRIIVESTSVGGNACTDEEKNECKKRYNENLSAARDARGMQDLGASTVTRPLGFKPARRCPLAVDAERVRLRKRLLHAGDQGARNGQE